MRSFLILSFVMCFLFSDGVCSLQAWAKKPNHRRGSKSTKSKARRPGYANTPRDKKLRREAAKELMRWLTPLSPKHHSPKALRSVMQWVQTWIASRWGLRLDRKAWKRWTHMTRLIGIWQPAPLYRDIRLKRVHPRLFTKLKGMKFKTTAPSPQQKWSGKIGTGHFQYGLTPIKRQRAKDRRPYRFIITSSTRIQPILAKQVDTALLFILRRFTDPQLTIPLTTTQKQHLSTMPPGHSRRIARWLNSRVPHTAALIRRYLNVLQILEPIGKGLYKLDLRARWRRKAFKKDYPRAAKILFRQKTDFQMKTTFRDSHKRTWFVWSYKRKTMEQRYQAVISKDGLWLCNNKWKPMAGPWRPTKMDSSWTTSTEIRYLSRNLKVRLKNFILQWRVKGHDDGATLSAALSQEPSIDIKGGRIIRLFARFLITGGISGLIQRFFHNLTHGDGGRGLRWEWRLKEGKQYATIDFDIALPIVPDSTLTALLRFGPSMRRRSRRSKGRRRKKRSRRRRRRKPPLWNRLFRAIYQDIHDAHTILTHTTH